MSQDNKSPETAEIEARFMHAGVVLPFDRKTGAIESAKAVLAATHWLRQPRTAAAEPSNIFSLAAEAQK
ncbi:MAG TPA: hypothetical protein VL418_16840 [Devosiaceae bacterium]|jgi:hypothetical protein|nr:hypothetical protein [Devosiaceae bacterium]